MSYLTNSSLMFNGELKQDGSATVHALDRGLLYGDGFFTTIQVREGQPLLWDFHLQRLQQCARIIFGNTTFIQNQKPLLEAEIAQLTRHQPLCGVRVTYTRGRGGRGYLGCWADNIEANRIVQCFNYPEHYLSWQSTGIHTELSQAFLGEQMPQLVGLKTLCRLEQVFLKQELANLSADEILVTDNTGFLLTATAANLFWRKNSTWYTPVLDKAGVHGTVRAALLYRYPEIQQVQARASVLYQADEAFITNALLGQVGLISFGAYQFPHVSNFHGWQTPYLPE